MPFIQRSCKGKMQVIGERCLFPSGCHGFVGTVQAVQFPAVSRQRNRQHGGDAVPENVIRRRVFHPLPRKMPIGMGLKFADALFLLHHGKAVFFSAFLLLAVFHEVGSAPADREDKREDAPNLQELDV